MKPHDEKPPIGLQPRESHDAFRAVEILHACERYIKAGKSVPREWISELQDLTT